MEITLDVSSAGSIPSPIHLPSDLIWENEFDFIDVIGGFDRTLGKTLIVWTNPLYKGRPIDLVANEERGWLSRETVELLHSSAQAMNIMVLTFHYEYKSARSFNVLWRYDDIPVLDVDPLNSTRVELMNGDYYTGVLKFIEI